MNNRETIEGVVGEWRTVTKAGEVEVGQRVRYIFRNDDEESFDVIHDYDSDHTNIDSVFNTLFRSEVQAFFPITKPVKRKVAKVLLDGFMDADGEIVCKVDMIVYRHVLSLGVYSSSKSALRGAKRFCKAIGYEMEVAK